MPPEQESPAATEGKPLARRLSLDPPLIPPAGRTIALTNEQIDEMLEE